MSHMGLFDRSTGKRSASSRGPPTIPTLCRLSAILAGGAAGYSRLRGASQDSYAVLPSSDRAFFHQLVLEHELYDRPGASCQLQKIPSTSGNRGRRRSR
jgi:hypothetical protein